MLAVVLLGCAGEMEGEAGNGTQIEEALPPENTSADEPLFDIRNCTTEWTLCPSGEMMQTRACPEGMVITYECEPYWKAHNLSTVEIPAHLRFLAEYKCYWENREAFGYTANYNPANVCDGPIVLGWKESCECASYIDAMEREKRGI